jgi:3',5'-cyclic AMP phosphodiesterase CpdA
MDFTIAHVSDMHVGSQHFVPNLMNRAITEINDLQPDVLVASGDFTNEGFRQEYKMAVAYLDRMRCQRKLYVPGNHDSRNVGYMHFEELLGNRFRVLRIPGATILSVDSSEPDQNDGRVGREWYPWILENFAEGDPTVRIFVMHHHLLPIPGTGRERSVVYDAGDLLEILVRANVNLVLTGHKHVPWVWRLESMYVATAGTVSSLKLRGHTKPCYNVIKISDEDVKIYRKYPFGPSNVIAHFSLQTGAQYQREIESLLTEPELRGD